MDEQTGSTEPRYMGGQAVLEGVMMRGPSRWAVAVRRADGTIETIAGTAGQPDKHQLQYTQLVMLDFNGIHWPHVTVGTLVKIIGTSTCDCGVVAATILGRRGTYTIRPEKIHLVDAETAVDDIVALLARDEIIAVAASDRDIDDTRRNQAC